MRDTRARSRSGGSLSNVERRIAEVELELRLSVHALAEWQMKGWWHLRLRHIWKSQSITITNTSLNTNSPQIVLQQRSQNVACDNDSSAIQPVRCESAACADDLEIAVATCTPD